MLSASKNSHLDCLEAKASSELLKVHDLGSGRDNDDNNITKQTGELP